MSSGMLSGIPPRIRNQNLLISRSQIRKRQDENDNEKGEKWKYRDVIPLATNASEQNISRAREQMEQT